MTEAEWLASDDPRAMLRAFNFSKDSIQGRFAPPSDRKLRLLACAISRRLGMHTGARLAAVEAWADGGPEPEGNSFSYEIREASVAAERCVADAYALAYLDGLNRRTVEMVRPIKAALLREIVGNPFRKMKLPFDRLGRRPCPDCPEGQPDDNCDDCGGTGEETVWGCPWLTPQVLTLAQAAYEERGRQWQGRRHDHDEESGWVDDGTLDPVRLAVLSDALEEAGCPDGELLRHLRGQQPCRSHDPVEVCDLCGDRGWTPLPGQHVRGCWALDLILGKE